MVSSPEMEEQQQKPHEKGDKFSVEEVVVSLKNGNLKDDEEKLVFPPSHFPQPEAPLGYLTKTTSDDGEDYREMMTRSLSDNSSSTALDDVSLLGKYIRDRGTALVKRISSAKEQPLSIPKRSYFSSSSSSSTPVTEFHLSGLKVIVRMKDSDNKTESKKFGLGLGPELNGRISFFSRSNCRDCGAVREFFRDKGLKYVEINIDVFPSREKDLLDRTGSSSVPQIFFNEKLLGGLVALNSLRSSGEFERRVREMAGETCPDTAPTVPVYGFEDDDRQSKSDEMITIVRFLRQRLPIQDKFIKLKRVKNCFSGADLVEAVINYLDCGRRKAVEIGKELARKHFIHHVFRENEFKDGNHFYHLLEHDPVIPKCFNFRGSTNDDEPRLASVIGQQLTKIMFAILESYASDDRRRLDYYSISLSEEFRRYVNLVEDLQRVDIFELGKDEKLAFFMNLYNAMVVHAIIKVGRPEGMIERRSFFNDFCYVIGGYPYSLSTIKNGILRSNQRHPPYTFAKPFSSGDKRLEELVLPKVNPLIHFGLCNANRSSPAIRFFSAQGIEVELRHSARGFFQAGGIQVELEKRTVHLSRIIKWYSVDFGEEKEILKWIMNFLDATKAGLLTHLLGDGNPVNVAYQDYDWSLNT